jgi:hypothetical protein
MGPEDISEDETPEFENYEDEDDIQCEDSDRNDKDQDAVDPNIKAMVTLSVAGKMLTGTIERIRQRSRRRKVSHGHEAVRFQRGR